MFIPANVIEDKANKLLHQYFKNDGIEEIVLPINPIDIAENYLGLTVDFDEIKEEDNQKILGAIYIKKK
ncbi:hypothetical protein [uncultured Clostridium sp.]|uniref:hypothetical protein n=1 Tax=uncultured Clostridium sp. TaxID=59620 RepID=UPI002610F89B|nr:hypothetical protein [uncultured Clostridium sp.]